VRFLSCAAALLLALCACSTLGGLDEYSAKNCGTPCSSGRSEGGESGDGPGADDVAIEDAPPLEAAEGADGADAATDATMDGASDVAIDRRPSDAADAADATGAADGSDASDAGNLAAGLVAFYRFDETSGTSASDATGNGYTATLTGGATFAAGLQANAVTLSGNSQYVSLPNGILSSLTQFSICTWVNLSAAPQWARIFDFGTGTTAYMFLTPNSASGTLRFSITTGGSGAEQQLNATALPTGSWQHLAVTLTGTTGTLYVNGAQVAQNTGMTLDPTSLGVTTHDWLGRSQFNTDPYLTGEIDDFRVYSRALSGGEVAALYSGHF
jgi:hypothetical protein